MSTTDASAPALLDVRDLSVDFHAGDSVTHAVKRVSFRVGRGETVALVGESGSGKSVSAMSILRLLAYPAASHPSGEIHFDGKDILKLPDADMREVRGGRISIIFQEPMTSLNPLHTIERQVGEMIRLHRRCSDEEARPRVIELLTRVGIRDAEKRLDGYPHQMSGGSASVS